MSETIILKRHPKIEFELLENGFNLSDGQSEQNSGFYAYQDIQSIELDKVWYPRFAKWLRRITWIFNGVPFFPDGETCKKAKVVFHLNQTKLGIWLTDTYMADKAKKLEKLLTGKIKHQMD